MRTTTVNNDYDYGNDASVDLPDEDEEFVTEWTEEREWEAKGQTVANPSRPKAPFNPGQDMLWSPVSTQPHYTASTIQPIDYIVANDMDFLEGNVVKYVTRWKHKNGIQDLEKMVDYAKRLLQREQARPEKTP
jgi:hypothetical protein